MTENKNQQIAIVVLSIFSIICFISSLWFFGFVLIIIVFVISRSLFRMKKLGKNEKRDQTEIPKIISLEKHRFRSTKGKTNVLDLSKCSYIPLPPSPKSWEIHNERDEKYYKDYSRKNFRKVFDTYDEGQYNKVVSLVETIPLHERVGNIGNTLLKAYRNLIFRWRNKGNLSVALKWSSQMLESLPELIIDTDKRRHNKLIAELESKGIPHKYSPCEIKKTSKNLEKLFTVPSWCEWEIKSEEPMHMEDRPDPALRDSFPLINGCLFIDKKGRSKKATLGSAFIQKRNRKGKISEELNLNHDIYRIGVNPLGEGFASLSSSCGLYIYESNLNILYEKDLRDSGEEKNYIRCVDVSPDMERFLYTIINKAYCLNREGKILWATQTSTLPGWERVVERVENSGTSQEVSNALSIFELKFPYEIDELKTRYKELARKWHPDLNPNDPNSHERMQNLNSSFEILTGATPHSIIDMEEEIVRFEKTLFREKIGDIIIKASISGEGRDWIYAASFDNSGQYTYLGAYSGRIIQLDEQGNAIRVFDVGSVPERIVGKGEYLYILTATRLYILRNETLLKIIDVFEKGKLIMAYSGFGLIAQKSFKWFTDSGDFTGEIQTKDPIRQVYSTSADLIIETRQHKAKIDGAPIWWPER